MTRLNVILLVMAAGGLLGGCGPAPVLRIEAQHVADSQADELAGPAWGKVEYAKGQYCGVAYDQTGVYVNLHGENLPELIKVTTHSAGFHRDWYVPAMLLINTVNTSGYVSPDASGDGIKSPKWLGEPMICQLAFVYGRTFWLSWQAFGMNGPPSDGKVSVYIHAMQRKGQGAGFAVGLPE